MTVGMIDGSLVDLMQIDRNWVSSKTGERDGKRIEKIAFQLLILTF